MLTLESPGTHCLADTGTMQLFIPLLEHENYVKTQRWGRILSPDFSFLHPTDLFTVFELRNPSHDISVLHKFRRCSDFEAGRSNFLNNIKNVDRRIIML